MKHSRTIVQVSLDNTLHINKYNINASSASKYVHIFMRLGLAVLRKHLPDGYLQTFLQDGFVLCV